MNPIAQVDISVATRLKHYGVARCHFVLVSMAALLDMRIGFRFDDYA